MHVEIHTFPDVNHLNPDDTIIILHLISLASAKGKSALPNPSKRVRQIFVFARASE